MRVRLKHERLARTLASSRLSQNAWALRLGLESSHLSKLVNGRRLYPTAATRRKLLRGLGLEFDELFEIENVATAPSRPPIPPRPTRNRNAPAAWSPRAWLPRHPGEDTMSNVLQEFRFAFRLIRKNPGFSFVAVLTLALGIGLNSAIFSLVNGILFRPLPVASAERLVAVYCNSPNDMLEHSPLSYPDFEDLRGNSTTLEGMLGYALTPLALGVGDENALIMGESVSGNYFSLLGVRPVLGRGFSPDEDRTRGTHPVTVLSHRMWQRRFGGSEQIIGERVRINGVEFTVIGVAPAQFTGLFRGVAPELWIPLAMKDALNAPQMAQIQEQEEPAVASVLDRRRTRWLFSVGRLVAGASIEQAGAELASLGEALARQHPESNRERAFLLRPAAQIRILPEVDTILQGASFVLMAVVGLVLLIASANVANLLLARAAGRRREVAVRLSVGASRGRLIRQLLIESLVLAWLAGGVGLLLTVATNALLNNVNAALPLPIDIALQLDVDYRVIGFTFGVCVLAALLFGLAPALQASSGHLVEALRQDVGGGSRGAFSRRFGGALVIAQISLSLLLLICAGLTVRSLLNAHRIDPGFDPSGVVMARFTPNLVGYDDTRAEAFYLHLDRELSALPGVETVTTASHLPLTFEINVETAVRESNRALPQDQWPDVDSSRVGPGYFETLRTPILRGRSFSVRDAASQQRVAVANERLAELLWPDQDALGQRLVLEPDGESYEIVGIARNGLYRTLGEETRPFLYRNIEQTGSRDRLVLVRTGADQASLLAALRQTARAYDEKIPVVDVQPVARALESALLLPEVAAGLFGLFGILGTLVASVGLYGVVAYMVSRRTREIGIRMALGASGRDVLRMVLGRGLVLTAVGTVLGVGAALLAAQVLSSLLYGISSSDLVTYAAVCGLLTGVAIVACLVPARRAKNLDPMAALRYE